MNDVITVIRLHVLSSHHQVCATMEEITGRLPDQFNMPELFARAQERTPYEVVALQECERMNFLIREIRSSLRELSLGLKVSVLLTFMNFFMSVVPFKSQIPNHTFF